MMNYLNYQNKLTEFFKLLLLCLLIVLGSCKKQPNEKKEIDKFEKEVTVDEKQGGVSDFETKLMKEGVNFYARGHEPSWSLDMDFDRQYHFKSINGEEMYVPNVPGEKAMDANMTRFYAHVEKGKLIVTLSKEPCQDSMADKVFDYSVNVQFKYGIDDEFKEFNGCGSFLPDLRLHDIWVLESINGEALNLDDNQRPRFEFYPQKNEILGHTDCNNFKTKFYITGYQEIQIEPVRMTKMSCDVTYESLLVKHAFGKRLKYSRDGLKLNLKAYDGTQFQFKKVD